MSNFNLAEDLYELAKKAKIVDERMHHLTISLQNIQFEMSALRYEVMNLEQKLHEERTNASKSRSDH